MSANAAEKDEYAKIRVNGNLDKIVKNLEMFKNIKKNTIKIQKL